SKRLPDGHDPAGLDEPEMSGGGVVGDPVGEDQRLLGVGPAGHGLERLDPHRDAAEWLGHVGAGCLLPCTSFVEPAEGTQLTATDGRQRCLQFLGRAALTGAEGVDERAGIAGPRLAGAHQNSNWTERRSAVIGSIRSLMTAWCSGCDL